MGRWTDVSRLAFDECGCEVVDVMKRKQERPPLPHPKPLANRMRREHPQFRQLVRVHLVQPEAHGEAVLTPLGRLEGGGGEVERGG